MWRTMMGGLDMVTSSRRRHRRINASGRCFAQLGGGWEGSVMNLSVGGMLLRLKRAFSLSANEFVAPQAASPWWCSPLSLQPCPYLCSCSARAIAEGNTIGL